MPAMLFAGMPYRGHETGRPRHSYKTGTVPSVLARWRQQLDLVTVRVFDEGQDAAAVLHRPRLAGDLAAKGTDVITGLVDIRHFQGDMAVAGAQLIAVHTPVVGQFDHAVVRLVAGADEGQGELAVRVILAPQQGHAQHVGVEGDGFIQIANSQHGVQQSHQVSPRRINSNPGSWPGLASYLLFVGARRTPSPCSRSLASRDKRY